ncbi:MAG: transglycosylase SLT domain-containing protein [Acidobacteriaceae bacterium]|nr:transglycosylase SLT domain-containing protein [Acidobacteriaceae bacterium]
MFALLPMMMSAYWDRAIQGRWVKIAAACLLLPASAQDLATLARAYRDDPGTAHRATLEQYAASHKDSSGALALLGLGSKEMEERQFAAALSHLEGTAKRLPTIADYPAYLTAAAQFELTNYAEVERNLNIVFEQTPASPLVGKAVILLANAYLKANEPKKAVVLISKYRGEIKVVESEILLAHAAEALGDATAATGHFQRVLIDFPTSKEDEDAESDPVRLKTLAPQAHLTRCVHLMEAGDNARAKKELEPLIPQLTGADSELARLKLGIAQYGTRAYSAAFTYLQSLQLTSADLEAERLYYLVRCARRLDRPQEFAPALERLAAVQSKSKWRLQTYLAAGDFYWLKHDVAAAESIYQPCASEFAGTGEAAECQWRLAWIAYSRRQTSSDDQFKTLVKVYPGSEHVLAALYFLGRSAEAKSDWPGARAYYDEVNTWYPNSYYAMLARERLRSAQLASASAATPVNSFLRAINFPSRTRKENFHASPGMRIRIERARLLASAGLDDLVESELRYAAKKDGPSEAAAIELAELAAQRDASHLGIRYIKQLAPTYLRVSMDSATEKLWKLAFPLPFRVSVEQASRAQGLDPFIVAALIRQESEFDPKVISHANAYGLTQLLPSTGREYGRKLNLGRVTTPMLFQPEINTQIGTFYLKTLLDQMEGKWEAALAAYNAGPQRVVKWLTWGDFREPAEFIEAIPFEETRTYVQSVLRNADVYRRLYGSKVAVATARK